MTTPTKHGGPAFPYAFQHEDDSRFVSGGFAPGMTLRDYFAGQVIGSLVQNDDFSSAVSDAYTVADMMLRRRKEKP